ncbi:MAG: exo-beta-N-acetylmuramidase NamZ domain-containing protein [Acidimicrobiales bacterium]
MRRHQLGAVALLMFSACTSQVADPAPITTAPSTTEIETTAAPPPTTTATSSLEAPRTQAEALHDSLSLLKVNDQVRVGLVAHRASTLPEGRTIDIIDSAADLELVRIFTPEHGLTGTADAGQAVDDDVEPITGVPIRSLYGQTREPAPADLADLDVVVYDLQDVGVRAYTYIATMGIMMDAAHAAGIPFIVVDRANPQDGIVDGPQLRTGLESFISPYPIPTSYGLSSGELARFLVGEGLIASVDLAVIESTEPPGEWIPPSPNLPTVETAWLYPAVVAFEATVLSEGRGTQEPFTLIGGPDVDTQAVLASMGGRRLLGLDIVATEFTPEVIPGMATNPRYEGQKISGIHLSTGGPLAEPLRVTVELLDAFMDAAVDRTAIIDRPDVFDRLVGDPGVREALLADARPADIAGDWVDDVTRFKQRSRPYRNSD